MFLKFVKCFAWRSQGEREGFEKLEVSIVDSIFHVVEEFDAKHLDKARNAKKIKEVIQKCRNPALRSTPVGQGDHALAIANAGKVKVCVRWVGLICTLWDYNVNGVDQRNDHYFRCL